MAGYGRVVGLGGGGALLGHEQGVVGMVGGACLGVLTLSAMIGGSGVVPVGGVGVRVGVREGGPSRGGLVCRAAVRWTGGGIAWCKPGVAPDVWPSPWGGIGVLKGNSFGISPRSAQVARLR